MVQVRAAILELQQQLLSLMNPYLITVSQKLKHKTYSDELNRYVKEYNLKRKQQGKGKKTMKHKITRKKNKAKESKKIKQKKKKRELRMNLE